MNPPKLLFDLPIEILIQIIEFVPNKVPLKLTCLDFFHIISKIETKKFKLVINHNNMNEYKVILRSICEYDEVKIHLWEFKEFTMHRLTAILHKFKSSLKKITFMYAAVHEKILIQILSMLPNLEEIIVDLSLINPSNNSHQKLQELKNVKNLTCKVESAKIIFELPNDVLTKLSFTSIIHDSLPSMKLMQEIIENQKNIVELYFDSEKVDPALLHCLELKKLRLASNSNSIAILESQLKLTSLCMQKPLRNEEFMMICRLQSLECLVVNVENVSLNLLKNLSRIQKLKELSISLNGAQSFCDIILSFLEKLEISFSNDTNTNEFFDSFPTNFPNLKHVELHFAKHLSIRKLLQNKKLESLVILHTTKLETVEELELIKHESLKQLTIEYSPHLVDLITKCLPNLQKLRVHNNLIKDSNMLKTVLMSCKRLLHLKVDGNCHLDVSFNQILNVLKEHGKNLVNFEYEDGKVAWNLEKAKKYFNSQYEFIYTENDGRKLVMRNEKWEN